MTKFHAQFEVSSKVVVSGGGAFSFPLAHLWGNLLHSLLSRRPCRGSHSSGVTIIFEPPANIRYGLTVLIHNSGHFGLPLRHCHRVLPATQQRWYSHPYTREDGTRFSDPGWTQGWVDPVLTATGLVNNKGQISTPISPKKLSQVMTSTTPMPLWQIWCKSIFDRELEKCVNCWNPTKLKKIFTCSLEMSADKSVSISYILQ